MKHDEETGNRVAMIFADRDATVTIDGTDREIAVCGYIPELVKLE